MNARNEQGTGNREQGTGNARTAELRKGSDIADRLLAFAAAIISLARQLPKDFAARHIAAQLIRSGTSGGANYEEARGAESRADFAHKARLATKEVRETVFWLKLLQRTLPCDTLDPLLAEANELVAILVASARTARLTD